MSTLTLAIAGRTVIDVTLQNTLSTTEDVAGRTLTTHSSAQITLAGRAVGHWTVTGVIGEDEACGANTGAIGLDEG